MSMNNIYLPIDEMLSDLRSLLERFQENPTDAKLKFIQLELNRIYDCCEDEMQGE